MPVDELSVLVDKVVVRDFCVLRVPALRHGEMPLEGRVGARCDFQPMRAGEQGVAGKRTK